MTSQTKITCLFTDVGGVLATNGWDHGMRQRAAKHFGLDYAELDERNHLTFDTYEVGKLGLDEYLTRVVFYEPRQFSRDEFIEFMFDQSQPFQPMIDFVCQLKGRHHLKLAVLSNEGRELMIHRIAKFKLGDFVDFYIVSSFVHFRKPDADIFRIALDIANMRAEQVVYIEDRPMFVDVANGLGMHGIHHVNLEQTRAELASLGLTLDG